jgi:hypothetical protein
MLLAQADILNLDFVIELAYLFPFLLIAIGIEKIFAKTRLKALSYLSSVLLVAGSLWVAFESSSYSSDNSFFKSGTISYEIDNEQVDLIAAEMILGEANMTVRSPSDDLFRARFGEWSLKPRANMEIADGVAEITLSARSVSRRFGGARIGIDYDHDDDWRVSFAEDIPLSLKCSGSRGDVHLNLAANSVRDLDLDLDDAEIYVKLGCLESEVRFTAGGDDSKLRIRIPQEAGLQVTGLDDPVFLKLIGLSELESIWVTDGYETAECQIQVELEDTFRSLSIDFY